LRVDALVAWFIHLAASRSKLRRFGPGGKGGPGEYASAANRCEKQFPRLRRKIDKYESQPDPGPYSADPAGGDPVAYCLQRFKSYDPRSGTYLGFDGLRPPCP
jgi:hypothetical protein